MKKILIGMVAVFCCLALAGPALAKITMSGMITTDAYYTDTSKERSAAKMGNYVINGAATAYESEGFTQINADRALTRLTMNYESEDKLLLGQIELRTGDQNARGTLDAYYAWMDWRPGGENLHFRFGLQPETFAIFTPTVAALGYNTTSTLFVNFGNLHASAVTGLKAYVRFNDMIRMEFGVFDPATGADESWLPTAAVPGPATGVQENSKIPRMDLSFPIKIANFSIEPSGTWTRKSYDYTASTVDDSFDIWGVALGAKAGFGPFTLSGEITYGDNLGNGNYTGGGNKPPVSLLSNVFRATARVDTTGRFADTEFLGWWLMGEFDFGPFAIQAGYGQEKNKNDARGTSGGFTGEILDTTRQAMAVRFPIKVAKGFTIAPQFQYLDFDNSAIAYGRSYDLGTEIVGGVQFQLVF